jgi:hypothetical protein
VAYSWIDATGGTVLALTGDDQVVNVALPFTFPFYQFNTNGLRVDTNGRVTLNTSSPSIYSNQPIPLSVNPDGQIALFWDDMTVPATGSIYFLTGGTAPNQYAVIEYHDVQRLGNATNMTYELVIYENGDILMQYQTLGTSVNGATVGIENFYGLDGLQYLYNEAGLVNGLAIRYDYPSTRARAFATSKYQSGVCECNRQLLFLHGCTKYR